jgi:hypothetical protein
MSSVYDELCKRFYRICSENSLLREQVDIKARVLTTEEAIGNPEGDDFPLQKGKERLMQAGFGQGRGQAFTDRIGDFSGRLGEILEMDLNNNFRRAVFVSAMNAVLNHLGRVSGTIHCRDKDPTICAGHLAEFISSNYGRPKITQVGYQPKMVERLQEDFHYRIVDLDPENIGQTKNDVVVEGPETSSQAIEWADLLLVTGTTLVNDSIGDFLNGKPILFYGTTVAGAAEIMNWPRFCACST